MAGPARLPPPPYRPPHQFPLIHSSRRAKGTILPTRVSRQKESTAGAARTSSNINRTAGACGLFYSHILAILFHITRAWTAHAGHLATRWNLDWCSPVSRHQHLSESIL